MLPIDLTGMKFGKLTVIKKTDQRANDGSIIWLCKCDCGNEKLVNGCNLRKKNGTRSCGCLSSPDLTGKKFDKITVIKRLPMNQTISPHVRYKCICDCGNELILESHKIMHKKHLCCEECKEKSRKTKPDDEKRSTEYRIWDGIKQRCYNPNSNKYYRYGKRGIKMCDWWKNNFNEFYKDMGPRPSKKHSIDRIDNDGDYCPENCRWATNEEQIQNSSCTKVTKEDIVNIRESYSLENKSIKDLSEEYNVSKSCIDAIILKKTWKNI